MSHHAPIRLWRLLSESFVPVILVLGLLFFIVIYVQYQAEQASTQVKVIDVGSKNLATSINGDDNSHMAFDEIHVEAPFIPELETARALIDSGNWMAAEKIYLAALKNSKTARLRTELGRIYLKQGKINKALVQFDKAILLQPPYPSAWFYRGIIMGRQGDDEAAIKDYNTLLHYIPSHYEGHMNLALIYLKQKKYVEAEKILLELTQKVGGSREAKAQYFLAISYKKQMGDDHKILAIKALKRAIRLKPDYIDARIQMVFIETDIKTKAGYEQALEQFKQILELKPNNAPSYFYLARIYSDAKHINEAIDNYRKAIQYNPGYRIARKNMGLLLLKKGRKLEAEEQFRWLINNFPDDSTNHFLLGRVAYGRKQYEDSITSYKEALMLAKGNYPEAHLNLGLTYAKQGNTKAALEQYNNALGNRDHYPQAWFNIGSIHMRNKSWKNAKQAFTVAIEQDQHYEQAWFNLALIHPREKNIDQAIEAYRKALAIRPNYRAAMLNLAVRYSAIKQFDQAIALYQDVLLKEPTYTSAWINLGITYGKIKNYEEAEEALQQAIRLEPENIKPRRKLAQILVILTRFSDAEALLRESIEMDMANVSLRIKLAEALVKSGNIEKAIVEIKTALRLDPNNKILKNKLKKLQNSPLGR